MRYLQAKVALLVLLAPVLFSLEGRAQDASPEAANRALATAFETAWNTHDMKALGRLLTEDVDWVNVDSGHGKGREQVETGHAKVHESVKFKDSVITVKNVEVAVLKPDVAVVHVTWDLRGDRDNDGTPRQPREGLFTWVTVKDGGSPKPLVQATSKCARS